MIIKTNSLVGLVKIRHKLLSLIVILLVALLAVATVRCLQVSPKESTRSSPFSLQTQDQATDFFFEGNSRVFTGEYKEGIDGWYNFTKDQLSVGSRFNVTIRLQNAVMLYAWQVFVWFQKDILNVTENMAFYHPDEPIHQHPCVTVYPQYVENATHGAVRYAVTAQGEVIHGFNGSFPLCNLEFEVKQQPQKKGQYLISAITFDPDPTETLWVDYDNVQGHSPSLHDGWYMYSWPCRYDVTWGTLVGPYYIDVFCDHDIASFSLNDTLRSERPSLSFIIEANGNGSCMAYIPRNRLDGPFSVIVDGISTSYYVTQTQNMSTLVFAYTSIGPTTVLHVQITGTERGYIIGDINHDGTVNMKDIGMAGKLFGNSEKDYP